MSLINVVFLFPSTPQTDSADMNYCSSSSYVFLPNQIYADYRSRLFRMIAVVVMGAVIGGSLLWYYWPKYGGVHWFKGPVPTIVTEEVDEEAEYVDGDHEHQSASSRDDKKPYAADAV